MDKTNDKLGKNIMTAFLLTLPNIAKVEDTDGLEGLGEYYYLDLIATRKDGKKIGIECKKRNIPSNRYGDVIIEKSKKDKAINDLRQHTYDFIVAANIFCDNVIAFDSIARAVNDTKCRDINKLAPRTTDGTNNDLVQKTFFSMTQTEKIAFETDGEIIYNFK